MENGGRDPHILDLGNDSCVQGSGVGELLSNIVSAVCHFDQVVFGSSGIVSRKCRDINVKNGTAASLHIISNPSCNTTRLCIRTNAREIRSWIFLPLYQNGRCAGVNWENKYLYVGFDCEPLLVVFFSSCAWIPEQDL